MLRSLETEQSTQPSAMGIQPDKTLGDTVWLKAGCWMLKPVSTKRSQRSKTVTACPAGGYSNKPRISQARFGLIWATIRTEMRSNRGIRPLLPARNRWTVGRAPPAWLSAVVAGGRGFVLEIW